MTTNASQPRREARARTRRLRARLQQGVDVFPFTGAGLLLTGASAVAFFLYGFGKIDLILLGVGAVGLGLGALCLLLTVIAALLTWRSLRRLPAGEGVRLECGYWTTTGFSVPSLWYLPFVTATWRWRRPDARVRQQRRGGRAYEEVFPERRGLSNAIERHFEIGDIFGLCKISFVSRQTATVRCLPWVGSLRALHVVRGMAKGDDISHPEGPAEGDRYDMRHYHAGDPIRFILWKVFAKSRDLIIRTPERALSPAKKTAVYMVADVTDEPAAGAARTAIDVDAFGGDWVLGADGTAEVTRVKGRALELLAQSANVERSQGGAGLSSFLAEAAPGSMARAVVFVPATPGPWLERVAHAARSDTAGRVSFIVGIDGVDHGSGRGRLGELMLGPAPPPRRGEDESPLTIPRSAELSQVVKTLGKNVLVVDRIRGQIFTPAQLKLTPR